MPGVLSCLAAPYKKVAMANRMKSLREKLRKLKNEIESFNFIRGSSTTKEQNYDERETTSRLPKEPVIGRDAEKQEIIKLLCANTNNNEIVIVPIYGLGGMGKSTLAQLVYNDAQFKKYDHRIWVYVSQDFNLNKLGISIISQLPTQGGHENLVTQQVINQCLDNLLQGKEVLIVLDDLWEEKKNELDKLRRMLHVKGSKVDIIVTTRKEDIARKVSTGQPYKLEPLEDDKCWEIIKKASMIEHKSNQGDLEQIGLEIAKKCGGVALAAQAIGFMLGSIHDLPGWTKINNSDIWNGSFEENGVLPSLLLSYERLPPQLRICFSYCAIFPKGHNIIEDDLVQQWVALDFTDRSSGKEYIKQLLGMSFLQVSKLHSTSEEHVVRYTMHDLVHDLARLTVADELIVFDIAPRRNTRAYKYCLYSLLGKYDKTMKLANMPSKMRALRFSDSGELDIQSGAFSFAKCLRILDFSESSGILLPASIGQLKLLRCLIAPRMQNESLPECITELSKLQYLNINGSSKITELPESIGNLGCLQYLSLSGCSDISKLPETVGNLTTLQHLELSRCSHVQALPESLCGLPQLQYLNLSHCESLYCLPEAIGSLIDLQYLSVSYCSQIRLLPESLLMLKNLLHLDLSGCFRMKKEALGCLRGLTALQHLNLSRLWYVRHVDLSDVLGHLTNLKYLRMHGRCWYVNDCIGTLTNLEYLELSANNKFECLPESIGSLKRLHTLDLRSCTKLKFLPESIAALGLKSLMLDGCSDELLDQASSLVHYSQTLPVFKVRADDVNGCSNLPLLERVHVADLRICSLENVRSLEEANKVKLFDKHNLSELTLTWTVDAVRCLEDKDLLGQLMPPRALKKICLQGYSSTSFPGWFMDISRHLTNLVSIGLSDLPTCRSLPPLGQLPHLERLGLSNLSSITKIDRDFCGGKGAFRRLSSFVIHDMKSSVEWNTTYSVDGVEEFMFPVLDHIEVHNCPRMRLKPYPPTFHEGIIDRSDQVIFSFEDVDKTGYPWSSSCRAIKLVLSIQGDSCQSIRIFHHFPVLRELTITGHHLTSVPESIRQLTSLESLTLDWCSGISSLPEWLGDLTSLKSLVITACVSIKSLPPCIQHLTKLQKLQISDSQQLMKWCESEENKAKLAHINVQVYEDDVDDLHGPS